MAWTYTCKPQPTHLKYDVFNSLDTLDKTKWELVVNQENLFLTIPYLKALENSLTKHISFKYVIFYDEERYPIGVSYMQIINCVDVTSNDESAISKLGVHIKNKILGVLDIKLLVCGNIFANGENGFHFKDSIPSNIVYDNLSHVLFQIRQSQHSQSMPSAVLLKEFWPQNFDKSAHLKNYDFREFMVDVNMVMHIHPSWNAIDDYLASMNTKFRTKAKSCFKKSKEIQIKDFDTEMIRENMDRIEALYLNVVDHADFQFSKLNKNSFIQFKDNLGEQYIFKGFFYNDTLVGFSTGFINGNVLEAGFIGLDYEYNFKYAVYQKMLYHYVELSIQNELIELRLGRTAEEIKSTLGAEPVNMKLYVRHRNNLSNKILKPIISSITPSEFEVRKPFKSSFLNS